MILSLVFFRVFVDRGVFSVIRRREYLFSFGGEVGFGLLFVGVLVGREVWFNKFWILSLLENMKIELI